ncbi:DUF4860 domain-containing protein [Petrocella sp. FN5]|uniref:DUF4860 domain-containing protein n=1 Tax=Petrocella sp. FN5 TaxID=3032002 RepID=UPI0023DAA8D4|nr:DUF4860 domain-containing protein [Petrocella sp. FN5]MDF1617788.1 DUF4860 domain-containing protein [Petrocella sp. FN5]
MSKRKINISVESIMVILLMIIFAVSISVLVYQGSQVYETILRDKEMAENNRIALSYINMKIKQNDTKDAIYLDTYPSVNEDVLVILHHGLEKGLITYVFFHEGALWECYTDGDLDLAISSKIIPLEGHLLFSSDATKGQILTTLYKHEEDKNPTRMYATLRTY